MIADDGNELRWKASLQNSLIAQFSKKSQNVSI